MSVLDVAGALEAHLGVDSGVHRGAGDSEVPQWVGASEVLLLRDFWPSSLWHAKVCARGCSSYSKQPTSPYNAVECGKPRRPKPQRPSKFAQAILAQQHGQLLQDLAGLDDSTNM